MGSVAGTELGMLTLTSSSYHGHSYHSIVIITGGVVGLGAGGHLAVGVLLRDGRQLLHLGHLLDTHSLRNVALGVRGVPEARVIIRVA